MDKHIEGVKLMDYLNFENRMTNELTVMFRTAEDPVTKEMARLQTLRTREWCRDYWVAMNREVPVRIRFSKEVRMNEHIEVVKKWLADNDSVSKKELENNRDSAYHAYANGEAVNFIGNANDVAVNRFAAEAAAAAKIAVTAAADAAFDAEAAEAAHAADTAEATEAAAAYAAAAALWIKRYEELST